MSDIQILRMTLVSDPREDELDCEYAVLGGDIPIGYIRFGRGPQEWSFSHVDGIALTSDDLDQIANFLDELTEGG